MKIGYSQAINSAANALYMTNDEIENVENLIHLVLQQIPIENSLTLLISLAQFLRKLAKEWACSCELRTLIYVIGLHAVQFGNNWMKKIRRTSNLANLAVVVGQLIQIFWRVTEAKYCTLGPFVVATKKHCKIKKRFILLQ